MSILEQLFKASFRNAVFLVRDTTTSGGRKTITHEFPNRDTRETEDLGKLEKTFTLTGIIGEPNYFEKRDALLAALENKGPGQLVHPFFGTVEVQSLQYTLTETTTDLSRAVFQMTFELAQPAAQPFRAGKTIQEAAAIGNIIQGQIIDNISNKFGIFTGRNINLLDAESNILNMLDIFEDNVSVNTVLPDNVAEFLDQITRFRDNVRPLIQEPSSFADTLSNLFDINSLIGQTPEDQIKINDKLFTFGNDFSDVPITTVSRRERQRNRDILQMAIKTNALKDNFIETQRIDFITDEDLRTRQLLLEDQFNEVLEFAETREIDIQQDVLPDETFFELQELRNNTREFFDAQALQTFRIVEFKTPVTSATVLSHRLFGNTDNATIIADLNRTRDPTFLVGNVRTLGA